jgi:hypothetical protein
MNTYRLILCPLSAALILAVLFAFANRSPTAVAQPGAPQSLTWTPCDDVADAECAFIKVPVDHGRPDGRIITPAFLLISRRTNNP